MYAIKPKEQPKWYELRKVLCRWLVNAARWVEPRSPEVAAFYMQQMQDMMITGGSITRIDPMTAQWDINDKDHPTTNSED